MAIVLDGIEQRVMGCLLEKAIVTPDQYPLTLNSLVNACNQKSARAPVMNLDAGEVAHSLRALQTKRLVVSEENFKSQTEKFGHRFCNTPFSDYQFDAAQYAAICVLLLRGARTPGEIRANSGRLHTFVDNEAVIATLQSLLTIEKGPLVAQLPRTPGRKDAEYCHLFSADAPTASMPEASAQPSTLVSSHAQEEGVAPSTSIANSSDDLTERVRQLEQTVRELVARLDRIQSE